MSFTDFIKLQEDHAHILLCDPWLNDVNVITREKLLLPETLARLPDKTLAAEVLVYVTPRVKMGRKGCGVIVELPEFNTLSPNVTGPQGNIVCKFLVLEDRMINEAPNSGTLRPANQVAQRILDLLHLDADDGAGTLAGRSIVKAKEWEPLHAEIVTFEIHNKRIQTPRVGPVTIAIADGSATLTCPTADARIYYTLNEGFPGSSNPAATLYEAPFPVASGQVIRSGAYLADYNQGPRRRYTVP